MQPTSPRRDWTMFVVIGAVLLAALMLLLCGGGGVLAWQLTQGSQDSSAPSGASPSASAPPSAASSPSPEPRPSPPTVSAADCLFGDWQETSYVNTAEIYGATVQLTGGSSGSVQRFGTDGTVTVVQKNVIRRGSAGGDKFEVIQNGTLRLNFQADDKTIHYSSPSATGTTTWKVNGRVRNTAKMTASIKPESYTCKGDNLRAYADGYAIELTRILPPGTPV